jgi:type IV pilus assembly protein PilN
MLVEINLLPQKEAKNKSLLVLLIIFSAILLIGGFFVYWLSRNYENKLMHIEEQLVATEQMVLTEQEKILSYESSSSLTELGNTVQWAQDYPIKVIPILKKLTTLLPERGFIQKFTYEDTGIINFTVQFETSRDAAYYLNSLLESNWLIQAKLNNLEAVTGFYDRAFGEPDDGPDESKLDNEKYIPRYVAEYELEVNREVFKQDIVSESSDVQGGADE